MSCLNTSDPPLAHFDRLPHFCMFVAPGAIHVETSIMEISGNSTFLFNVAGIDGGGAVEPLCKLLCHEQRQHGRTLVGCAVDCVVGYATCRVFHLYRSPLSQIYMDGQNP